MTGPGGKCPAPADADGSLQLPPTRHVTKTAQFRPNCMAAPHRPRPKTGVRDTTHLKSGCDRRTVQATVGIASPACEPRRVGEVSELATEAPA